jgi:hypothetical protein
LFDVVGERFNTNRPEGSN